MWWGANISTGASQSVRYMNIYNIWNEVFIHPQWCGEYGYFLPLTTAVEVQLKPYLSVYIWIRTYPMTLLCLELSVTAGDGASKEYWKEGNRSSDRVFEHWSAYPVVIQACTTLLESQRSHNSWEVKQTERDFIFLSKRIIGYVIFINP